MAGGKQPHALPQLTFSDSLKCPPSTYPAELEELAGRTSRFYVAGTEPPEHRTGTLNTWLSKLGNGLVERLLNVEDPLLPPAAHWDPAYRNIREELAPTMAGGKVSFNLPALPAGYRLYLNVTQYANKPSSNRRDWYLYGCSLGNVRYRSPNEFLDHLVWMVTDPHHNFSRCLCKYCPARFKETLLAPTFTQWPTYRVGEIVWVKIKVALVKLRSSQGWTWKVTKSAQELPMNTLDSNHNNNQDQATEGLQITPAVSVTGHRDMQVWPAVVQECFLRFDINPVYTPDMPPEQRWIVRYQNRFELLGVGSSKETGGYSHQRVFETTEDQMLPYLAAQPQLADPTSEVLPDADDDSKQLASMAAFSAYVDALSQAAQLRQLFWPNFSARPDPLVDQMVSTFDFTPLSIEKTHRHIRGLQLGAEYIGLGDIVRIKSSDADSGYPDQASLDAECRAARFLEVVAIIADESESVTVFGVVYRISHGAISSDSSTSEGISMVKVELNGEESHRIVAKADGTEYRLTSVSVVQILGRFYADYPLITDPMNQHHEVAELDNSKLNNAAAAKVADSSNGHTESVGIGKDPQLDMNNEAENTPVNTQVNDAEDTHVSERVNAEAATGEKRGSGDAEADSQAKKAKVVDDSLWPMPLSKTAPQVNGFRVEWTLEDISDAVSIDPKT